MVRAAPRLALLALALACVAASPRAALGSSVGFGPEASRALDLEAWERLQELGEITDASDGSLERTFLSPASRRAMDVALAWMRDAGMRTWTDEAGNVHGRVDGAAAAAAPPSSSPSSSSRPSAAADPRRLPPRHRPRRGQVRRRARRRPRHRRGQGAGPGVRRRREPPAPDPRRRLLRRGGGRFGSTFLGSRALVGAVPDDVFDRVADADGLSFLDALRLNGFEGTRAAVERATLDPADVAAYVEVHIEQGPVLQRAREPAAAVSAIAGANPPRRQAPGGPGTRGDRADARAQGRRRRRRGDDPRPGDEVRAAAAERG